MTDSPIRVLVVANDPSIRLVVHRMLTVKEVIGAAIRYEHVAAVASIPIALEWLMAHNGADLIIADVALPSGEWSGHPTPEDGVEFAKVVCQRWPETRFVVISPYPSTDLVRWGVIGPGAPFLAKPFAMSALLTAVNRALAGRPCLLPERRMERRA
jgi:DNA-binding NarL/FixJ family response regulator